VEAGQRVLADTDVALANLKAMAEALPADLVGDVQALRTALLDDGFALTRALTRATEEKPADVARQPAKRDARVLSNEVAVERPRAAHPAAWVLLAVMVALGGAYHGWGYVVRSRAAITPMLDGQPRNTMLLTGGGQQLVVVKPGMQVDAAELDKFRAEQAAKGRVLRSIGKNTWVVETQMTGPGGNQR
jgi:hypothetical protein